MTDWTTTECDCGASLPCEEHNRALFLPEARLKDGTVHRQSGTLGGMWLYLTDMRHGTTEEVKCKLQAVAPRTYAYVEVSRRNIEAELRAYRQKRDDETRARNERAQAMEDAFPELSSIFQGYEKPNQTILEGLRELERKVPR